MNLNSLTQTEIQELKRYVEARIDKKDKSVQIFFQELEEGKLKAKNVEPEGLDFIYEGLTELTEEWLKMREKKQNQENEEINFEEGIHLLKKGRQFRTTIQQMRKVEKKPENFNLTSHDIEHTQRVILNVSVLMEMFTELTDREKEMIRKVAELHDQGRIHDWEDDQHGEKCVQQLTHELDNFLPEEQELIKFLIIQHCKSKQENERVLQTLDKSKCDRYRKFLGYIKDADKLDRVRFLGGQDALDPTRLTNDAARRLIKFAQESLVQFKQIASMSGLKTIHTLFRRDLVFSQGEFGEELANSVKQLLIRKGYPERSRNINLNRIMASPQEQFIKGEYIYLLRGGRREQMSGFYAYPYCTEKKNLAQYCQEHPEIAIEEIAEEQTDKGKCWFISATTSLPVTTRFARGNDANRDEKGSVYIIKIKKQKAYRRSPFNYQGTNPFQLLKVGMDENEYLIPDYVAPEEIIKEFEYDDYLGIYRYLTEEIGLDLKPEDLDIKGGMKKQVIEKYLSENILRRKEEEKVNQEWEKNEAAQIGYKIFQKMMREMGD